MLALEGKQLGNYDVTRRIRVGGMGAVYEGKQRTAFGRRVAIKVILGNYAADPEMRRRFAREARTIARLHHPHILPLIEFGDADGILYLVMPFIEGGTLTSYLRHSLPDISEAAAMFLQLLDAVEYAHDEGLIHRDIKSSNVLLESRRSGPPYIYLADFGLVRTSQMTEFEQAGEPIPLELVPGTPHYMAPEQTMGIVTPSSDIYALGVLLYQILAGQLPYDDPDEIRVIQKHLYAPIPSLSEYDASIPIELDEVVRTAMAKQAEDRFHTIAKMRKAFLAAIEGPAVRHNDELSMDLDAAHAVPEFVAPPPSGNDGAEFIASAPVSPEPMPSPLRRVRRATTSVPPGGRHRQRITEDFVKRKQKHLTLPLVATMFVPVLLLILLILPRVLNFSLFPPEVPLLGNSPVATVSVTAQTKLVHDTYLLTASPQVTAPGTSTRIIPDHLLQAMSQDSSNITTTGTQTIPATQASGTILFDNKGDAPISVPTGIIFTTNSGVQIKLLQSTEIPSEQNGQDGTISVPAQAVYAGVAGNIPARALATRCCNGQVFLSNPEAFTGGVDSSTVHVLAQADVDRVKNMLGSSLEQKLLQQLQKQLRINEMMAAQPSFSVQALPDTAVGTQVGSAVVHVTVTATVWVYNRAVARQIAEQLLDKEASQALGSHYRWQDTPSIANPVLVQQEKNGILYLSVSAHGIWVYNLTTQQMNTWLQFIKGATPVAATDYLKAQPGVASVQINLPFDTDHLPSSLSEIKIVLANA